MFSFGKYVYYDQRTFDSVISERRKIWRRISQSVRGRRPLLGSDEKQIRLQQWKQRKQEERSKRSSQLARLGPDAKRRTLTRVTINASANTTTTNTVTTVVQSVPTVSTTTSVLAPTTVSTQQNPSPLVLSLMTTGLTNIPATTSTTNVTAASATFPSTPPATEPKNPNAGMNSPASSSDDSFVDIDVADVDDEIAAHDSDLDYDYGQNFEIKQQESDVEMDDDKNAADDALKPPESSQ